MSLAADQNERCAAVIVACRGTRNTLDGHGLALLTPDEPAGYAVQRLVGARLARNGLGGIAGYKIGMTSPELMARFGLNEPLYGSIHWGGRLEPGATLRCAAGARPLGLECEIAITLAGDLGDRGRPHDAASVGGAIGTFHPAIEIVENRFASLDGVSPWIVVADGVLHHRYVLGPGIAALPPPAALEGELWVGETRLSSGCADMLYGGGPVETLVWLANKLIAQGRHLVARDVVLCGSVGPAAWPTAPLSGRARAAFPGLGEVSFVLDG
jgi:2-keto-4-pentenoate hydratase